MLMSLKNNPLLTWKSWEASLLKSIFYKKKARELALSFIYLEI